MRLSVEHKMTLLLFLHRASKTNIDSWLVWNEQSYVIRLKLSWPRSKITIFFLSLQNFDKFNSFLSFCLFLLNNILTVRNSDLTHEKHMTLLSCFSRGFLPSEV